MSVSNFHILAKPIGPVCNMACKYCFYLEKESLYPGAQKWAMRPEVLESYVRQYIEAHDSQIVNFAWQGGEPTLLGVEYFRRLLALQRKYANGKSIANALQTNGVLLNDEWADFFRENRFLIGVSIDGPAELHDAYRLDKRGRATFSQVMQGIETLKRNGVEFNTLTTVHRANGDFPLEVYRFLREAGSGFMQFIPIVERIAHGESAGGPQLVSPGFAGAAKVAPWSVGAKQFGRFLCAIFDEWVRKDVGRQYVQLFDVTLEIWAGMEPSLCVFNKTCGEALAIEHNGDLYSCDHFVYAENRLGNIMDHPLKSLVESQQQRQFGVVKKTALPNSCRECDVRFACNGECPKHRFLNTSNGESGLNYLCAGYKMFFHHVAPYMRFMASELAAERAPANVMNWAIAADMQRAFANMDRNAPCPCGSGRKFKRCCSDAT